MTDQHHRHHKKKEPGRGALIATIIFTAAVIAAAVLIVGTVLYRNYGPGGSGAEESVWEEENAQTAGREESTGEQEAEAEPAPETEEERLAREIAEKLMSMTLEEKVCQLFMITPEALTGADPVVQAGDMTREALNTYPVGGLIYFAKNLQDPEQTRSMLANTQQYARERTGLPIFLSVDEEGGQVARVAGNPAFGVTAYGYMSDVGSRGDTQEAYEIGTVIGAYLKDLGFNMDAAPDTDVLTNPANEVVRYRSFGSDPELVSRMAEAELKGLNEQGIIGMYKHFPGHGGTTADSHAGYAYVDDTLEELEAGAFVPFRSGIENGIRVIMVSHISCPNVTGDNTPATLSPMLITDILRNEMGFDGIVITDALNMGAITAQYSSDQAAVAALTAGADILLMPEDFQTAYQGVLNAVADGTVTEERINESVERILKVKSEM